MPFDLDRAVQIRTHPSGMQIGMYLGLPNAQGVLVGAEYGVYYDAHGKEVTPRLAHEAGFDVEANLITAEEQVAETQMRVELEQLMAKKRQELAARRARVATLSQEGEKDATEMTLSPKTGAKETTT